MPIIELKSHKDGTTLYQGEFNNIIQCLERAITEHVDLRNISLIKQNLSNANLDEGMLENANFSGSNLTGANLSECELMGANFNSSAPYNTFLCYSDMQNCNFENTSFGATDITGSNIKGSIFSTLSCFDLDFNLAKDMSECRFQDISGNICDMSRPPVIIKGLPAGQMIFMDKTIKIAGKIAQYSQLSAVLKELNPPQITNSN